MENLLNEKIHKEIEQLKKMNNEDASEVLQGYHKMLLETISNCLEKIEDIANLSPATIAVSETAILIAENDFLDEKKRNGEIGCLGIIGSQDSIEKLIDKIWNQKPEIFEEVCKKRGYEKVAEKETA